MNNLLSYCGLVDALIRASDKDLPVQKPIVLKSFGSLKKSSSNFLAKSINFHTRFLLLPASADAKASGLGFLNGPDL